MGGSWVQKYPIPQGHQAKRATTSPDKRTKVNKSSTKIFTREGRIQFSNSWSSIRK
jgi:hypothetical protein